MHPAGACRILPPRCRARPTGNGRAAWVPDLGHEALGERVTASGLVEVQDTTASVRFAPASSRVSGCSPCGSPTHEREAVGGRYRLPEGRRLAGGIRPSCAAPLRRREASADSPIARSPIRFPILRWGRKREELAHERDVESALRIRSAGDRQADDRRSRADGGVLKRCGCPVRGSRVPGACAGVEQEFRDPRMVVVDRPVQGRGAPSRRRARDPARAPGPHGRLRCPPRRSTRRTPPSARAAPSGRSICRHRSKRPLLPPLTTLKRPVGEPDVAARRPGRVRTPGPGAAGRVSRGAPPC